MGFLICVLFLFLLRFYEIALSSSSHELLNRQADALLDFKLGISSDPDGVLGNWTQANVNRVCSNWYGVICNHENSSIIGIHLVGNGLNGILKPSLCTITSLQTLLLGARYDPFAYESYPYLSNSLAGPVPLEIGVLKNLTRLDLSHNRFSGSILPHIRALNKLQQLNLSHNEFDTGRILPLFALKNLHKLDLSYNQFIGSIPSEIDSLTQLITLDLSHNMFNQSIPPEIGQLKSLRHLDLSFNDFTGSILSEIGALKNLKRLDLSFNKFTGSIPFEIGALKNLEYLDLSSTKLTGSIPFEIGALKNLEYLDFSSTGLNGSIPSEIGALKRLKKLHLSFNELIGNIPESIGNCSSLEHIIIRDTNLTGDIPASIGNLQFLEVLYVEGGNLSGRVPDEIGNCSRLRELYVHEEENIIGPLTTSIYMLSKLEVLSLQNLPTLGGSLSPLLGNMTFLSEVNIDNCAIEGVIPQEMMHLQLLEVLSLKSNHLRGKLPTELLSYASRLWQLYLSDNSLEGEIPQDFFRNATRLNILMLQNNHFTGVIPRVSNLTMLTSLFLQSNRFEGRIPFDFLRNLFNMHELDFSSNLLFGEIPQDALLGPYQLDFISLRHNKFQGPLPHLHSWCTVVDFSYNRFNGQLSSSIFGQRDQNYLEALILRNNELTGNLESMKWLWNFTTLHILDLADNRFEGSLPQNFSGMKALSTPLGKLLDDGDDPAYVYWTTVFPEPVLFYLNLKGTTVPSSKIFVAEALLDLSKNHLIGELPSSLFNLPRIRYLSLSHNGFTGKIPESFGTPLEALDLSYNCLTGSIPASFAKIDSLTYFNVSYNDLEGRIPSSPHFSGFLESYYGNPGLCGPPLTKACPSNKTQSLEKNSINSKGWDENVWDKNVSPISFAVWFFVSFTLTLWTITYVCYPVRNK